jgi:hypothetical protein
MPMRRKKRKSEKMTTDKEIRNTLSQALSANEGLDPNDISITETLNGKYVCFDIDRDKISLNRLLSGVPNGFNEIEITAFRKGQKENLRIEIWLP